VKPLPAFVALLLAASVSLRADEALAKLYTIPSWGDFAAVYAEGVDSAMDSPEGMERMFAMWKARGLTGVFLRSDLQQYEPFVHRNPRVQMNAALALMLRHIDDLASRFDYFDAAQRASQRTGLEFWVYHPHIYSDGAPPEAGTPGVGRMLPWGYISKAMVDHPQIVTVDRRGNKYWMVPEYAYPEARRAKVGEFVHMAKRYGIRHFIANMRSEVSQLQDPADKADRFGFNAPVVADMQRLHGVDIMTDPRFDVDSPTFDPHDAMVEKWRDLRGSYLTQLFREMRAGLREVDPKITLAITLAGEHIGPPLGNWRTDWRTWVDEGIVDFLISPSFFEATLDHDAHKKGYLTNSRAGVGTVPHPVLKDYILRSKHPEIQIIASGSPPFIFITGPAPAGADARQTDAWGGAYHLAWHQRWQQWQRDLREFGHIRFIEQNFDTVSPQDRAMPSGAWGAMAYVPALRACPGGWWRLGDGSDGRPFAQSAVRHGDHGQAMQLTRTADGSGTLTGWHNTSPDRSKASAALDTSMSSGRCTFEFWLMRQTADSGIAAYLQGDSHEPEVGVRVAPGTGKLSFSTGADRGTGKWTATDHTLPVGEWRKFSIEVDIDHLHYAVRTGETVLSEHIPISAAKDRIVEQPGVNIPIRVPSFKEFKTVLFVPDGAVGSVTFLDDVAVHWQPAAVFVPQGKTVEFSDDFESYPHGMPLDAPPAQPRWQSAPNAGSVTADTSFGEGVKSLRANGGARFTAKPLRALRKDTRLVADLDLFLRSGEYVPTMLPGAATHFPHGTVIGWHDGGGKMLAGIAATAGTWRLWNGTEWTDTKRPVHCDVWNHLQIAVGENGVMQFAVQPVGQVAALIGSIGVTATEGDSPVTFTIETPASEGHVSCYDNVLLTSGAPAGEVRK
jgi:hypothetical protein